jgi:predicted NodU family carbamoyl transferase
MIILGINAYHANASAAIVADGKLLAAVEEERFNPVCPRRRLGIASPRRESR